MELEEGNRLLCDLLASSVLVFYIIVMHGYLFGLSSVVGKTVPVEASARSVVRSAKKEAREAVKKAENKPLSQVQYTILCSSLTLCHFTRVWYRYRYLFSFDDGKSQDRFIQISRLS